MRTLMWVGKGPVTWNLKYPVLTNIPISSSDTFTVRLVCDSNAEALFFEARRLSREQLFRIADRGARSVY